MQKIFVLVALLLTGCAAQRADTPSGSPEITLSGVRPDRAKQAIANAMLNSGLRIKNDTAYSMVFEGPWTNAAAAAAIAVLVTTDISPPIERLSFAIIDSPNGIRVVVDRTMVKYAGTGREQSNPANNAPGMPPLQAMLDDVAAKAR